MRKTKFLPIHCQCVLRTDAVNRFESTSSSKAKKVPQDHKIARKIRKRADDQYKVSAIFTMGLENLCEYRARVLQIEIMSAFLGVSLNLLRSGIRCHGKGRQSFELNKGFTVVESIWWRVEWTSNEQANDISK